jgi:hypothetical protein
MHLAAPRMSREYESPRGRMQSQPESPEEAARAFGAKRGRLKRSEVGGKSDIPKSRIGTLAFPSPVNDAGCGLDEADIGVHK